jgi:hypothetical protein
MELSDQVIRHRENFPRAASDAWFAQRATVQETISFILWELEDCLLSCEPDAPKNGLPVDSFHAGCCALRAYAMLLNLQDNLPAVAALIAEAKGEK